MCGKAWRGAAGERKPSVYEKVGSIDCEGAQRPERVRRYRDAGAEQTLVRPAVLPAGTAHLTGGVVLVKGKGGAVEAPLAKVRRFYTKAR